MANESEAEVAQGIDSWWGSFFFYFLLPVWNAFVLAGALAAMLVHEVNMRIDYLLSIIKLKGQKGLSLIIW